MKKFIATCIGLALSAPVLAHSLPKPIESKITKGWYTNDAMGCMMLRECTEGVQEVFSIADISDNYNRNFDHVSREFHEMLVALNYVGVKVYLGDEKYFPVGNRGVYHTVGNNFFLNKAYMGRPSALMSVMRHEGWHAAQDCMAGTIDNSLIAIILPEDMVPPFWREIVERTYPAHAVPWEAEATWAGKTVGMTADALNACASGRMWIEYEPTPLTRKYLVEEGYIK